MNYHQPKKVKLKFTTDSNVKYFLTKRDFEEHIF
jgi:hypothetical protein